MSKMKALILTYAPVTNSEKELIDQTNILKIAVNSAPYSVDYRVFRDKWQAFKGCKDKLITSKFNSPRLHGKVAHYYTESENPNEPNTIENYFLYFYCGTITTAIDFAIKEGASDILLIANNKVHSTGFQEAIKKGIEPLKKIAEIYKYRKSANLNLEYKNIKDFLNDN